MKYEYKKIAAAASQDPIKTIEEHSKKGWECFSVTFNESGAGWGTAFREFYFKRIDPEWELEMIKSRPIGL